MRGLVFLLFATTLAGCSGMMMGGGTPTSSTSERERAARIQASQDAMIVDRIKQKYAGHPTLKDARVFVSSTGGIARISGSVPGYGAREDAERLAISVDGVKSVENRITVEFSN